MRPKLDALHHAAVPIQISIEDLVIYGDLEVPFNAIGSVIFIHGSGSSRFSSRNQYVAEELNKRRLATLLLDLLTEDEHEIDEETRQYRFDIPLLAHRSTLATNWLLTQATMRQLPIGLFGASTGAAAALITAASMKQRIAAIVSRGGRPDLAEEALNEVESPTLLIVGGDDNTVVSLNKKAISRMHCLTKLHIVPGATHLFEEPGALEQVATVAGDWFVQCMSSRASHSGQKATGGR